MGSRGVLDYGFVQLDDEDFMGGDLAVVNKARISYAKQHKQMEEGDDKLIRFLMKHRHGTPFEASVFNFHVKAPLIVAREWMRHRVASYNELSGRYVKLPDEIYLPADEAIRTQTGRPGQYKYEQILDPAKIQAIRQTMVAVYEYNYRAYERLLGLGLAKEVARGVLPQWLYTEFYYMTNARALMNFLNLRNAPSALHEIREYAIVLEKFFEQKMPVTYRAFVDNGRVAP